MSSSYYQPGEGDLSVRISQLTDHCDTLRIVPGIAGPRRHGEKLLCELRQRNAQAGILTQGNPLD